MAKLPPAVTEAEFQAVDSANPERIRQYFEPFKRELHSYLNRASCLQDIQRWRKNGTGDAFHDKSFKVIRRHWYTYNWGGRSEAQFNIGLFPDYMRIGLGFECTENIHGNPERAQEMYEKFTDILRQYRKAFERFVREDSLEIEWRLGGPRLQYVPTQDVASWLLDSSQEFEWMLVGRLLRRGQDAEILEDPTRLKEVMESVFKSLKYTWEQVQREAKV